MTDKIAIKRAQKACFLPSMSKFAQFYCAKLHIILYIKERFRQKVKIVKQFVKQKYQEIVVTLHRDLESRRE